MPERAIAVLVGAPGAGKTTVGSMLAARLGVEFIDVDRVIERRARRPITEIFAAEGESHFRRLELVHTVEAINSKAVVALGGGAVTNPAVRDALVGHRVVWLGVDAGHAVRRVGSGTTRPLLRGDVAGKWAALAAARERLYGQVATIRLDTDELTADEVAARLTAMILAEQE